ncbi:MAG: glucose 1-dehydrogenase [Anaerolineae bacterium]
MSFSLEGRVAIVTGGSRGIGQGIAEAFGQAGAAVVVTARSLDRVEPVAKGIEAAGGRALAIACHTGHDDQVKALIDTTRERFGRLDILVNNAATNPHFGPAITAEPSIWAKTLDTNVLGYLRVAQAAVPAMQAVGGGKIINVASTAGINPMPGLGVYAVSKAAVIMLTKVLAVELGHMNIQVNAVAPGVIKTRFSQVLWQTPEIASRVLQETPAGRIGEVDDVTGAMLYFASSASDYTTGTVLVIDGGQIVS